MCSERQAMYQREAMWVNFTRPIDKRGYAVKVSVGGVNALTGTPRDKPPPNGKQDYLAVDKDGQM